MFNQEIVKKSKTVSKRPLQIAKQIQKVLSAVFVKGDINNRILFDKTILVAEVDVSDDLSVASVKVIVSNNNNPKEILEELKKMSGFFRSAVAKHLTTKITPQIKFYLDDKLEKIEKVDKLFREINSKKGEVE